MKAFLVFSFLVFLHYSGGCIKKGSVLNLGNIQIDIDSVVGKMNLHPVQSIDKVYLYLILNSLWYKSLYQANDESSIPSNEDGEVSMQKTIFNSGKWLALSPWSPVPLVIFVHQAIAPRARQMPTTPCVWGDFCSNMTKTRPRQSQRTWKRAFLHLKDTR